MQRRRVRASRRTFAVAGLLGRDARALAWASEIVLSTENVVSKYCTPTGTAAAVAGLGIVILVHGDDSAEKQKAGRLGSTHGRAILALGLSTSLDEFAIGLSVGLGRLPVVPVIIAIAIVAPIASQLGLALDSRISDRFRERAERFAAIVLILARPL